MVLVANASLGNSVSDPRKGARPVARKKKQRTTAEVHPDWVISHEMTINGRTVEIGTELSIKGEPGRFRFLKHIKTPTSEWIDVIGGKQQYQRFRSFRTDSVRTVHRLNRIRPAKGKS
jgi:hypothetical protein